jgi:alkylation response protein AidB-like acyl-CoA dehydrogenase
MYCSLVYETVEALERHLGDPMDPTARMSFKNIVTLDEREEHPDQHLELLHSFGLHTHFVPREYGGQLDSYQHMVMLYRSLARRDITLATCAMLFSIGYSACLVAGTEEQKQRLARFMLDGGKISWGLSERATGSDVIANETRAVRSGQGYRLTGSKWPIGNATRGDAMVVYARTGAGPQPDAYSLFLFDKRTQPRQHYTLLPRERLYGLRGMDLSGIEFKGCELPESARIGREGEGLEITLKAAQLMRSSVITIALGAADTALRLALGFACERHLFGQRLADVALSRRQLTEAFADIVIGEVQLIAASRALHLNPKQLNLWASIVKYQVPTMLERTMHSLAAVIGCRYYLREQFGYGMFQKMLRDIGIAGFVDGNTVVNLKVIALQMPLTFKRIAEHRGQVAPEVAQQLARLFDPLAAVPPANAASLTVFSRGEDPILEGLRHSLDSLDAMSASDGMDASAAGRAVCVGQRLWQRVEELSHHVERDQRRLGRDFNSSAEIFAYARQYALLHAAASCVHFAVYGVRHLPGAFADLHWLPCCLSRIEQQFAPFGAAMPATDLARLADTMHMLYEQNRAFSPVAYQYAGEMRPLSYWDQLHI